MLSEELPARSVDDKKKPQVHDPDRQLRRTVESKIMDGNISAAVRILTSEDSIAPVDHETVEALRLKHPPETPDSSFPEKFDISPDFPTVSEGEVWTAIMSFPDGSAGGLDEVKP